jgi:hypothetical protein
MNESAIGINGPAIFVARVGDLDSAASDLPSANRSIGAGASSAILRGTSPNLTRLRRVVESFIRGGARVGK